MQRGMIGLAMMWLTLAAWGQVTSGTLIARAAARQVGVTLNYDPTYRVLPYPNGDVPRTTMYGWLLAELRGSI